MLPHKTINRIVNALTSLPLVRLFGCGSNTISRGHIKDQNDSSLFGRFKRACDALDTRAFI